MAAPSFRWRGGADGLDRPLDRAFVSVQRLAGGRWRTVDDDLGLRILWRVDDDKPKQRLPRFRSGEAGRYTAWWEPALSARHRPLPLRRHRRRYRLVSRSFRLRPAGNLVAELQRTGRAVTVRLAYPPATPEVDFTARPSRAASGRATLRVDGRRVHVPIHGGSGTAGAHLR